MYDASLNPSPITNDFDAFSDPAKSTKSNTLVYTLPVLISNLRQRTFKIACDLDESLFIDVDRTVRFFNPFFTCVINSYVVATGKKAAAVTQSNSPVDSCSTIRTGKSNCCGNNKSCTFSLYICTNDTST